jgi:CRP-like cAMP-binding protein
MSTEGWNASGRPGNNLLQHLNESDYVLIRPYIEIITMAADDTLYNAGDDVETVYFPCEGSVACLVLVIEDGREVQVVMIGREGAVGGIVSRGRLPAFSRVMVRFGGLFARLSVRRLQAAKERSATLRNILARYADCLLAQTLQTGACNAAHSIEQRAAKWILASMDRTEQEVVPLSHEQLATMLGVGRSYASRVITALRAEGILDTRRMSVRVLNKASLRSKACDCDDAVKSHFAEVFRSVYPARKRGQASKKVPRPPSD